MPSARALDAGKAIIKLSLKDEVSKGLDDLLRRTKAVGDKMKNIGAKAAAAGLVIVGAFAAASKTFIETGAAIDDMAKRTGFGAESLSKLKFAAEQSGAGLDDIGAAAVDTLSRLGVTLGELQALSPEARFERLADAISKIEDPTLRAALASKTFGGAGRALLPLLVEGAAGFKALGDTAQQTGQVMSEEAVAAAAELDDKLTQLKGQLGALAVAAGVAIAEPLTKFVTLTTEVFEALTKWAGANPGLIKDIAGIGAAAVVAGGAVGALGLALTLACANPILLGIAGVTAAVVGLPAALDSVEDKAGKVFRLMAAVGAIDPQAPEILEKCNDSGRYWAERIRRSRCRSRAA